MYRITKEKNHLLVTFKEDFDFNTVQVVIHHLTRMDEYPHTNDIWMIGPRRANIRLREVETMVHEFQCRCPDNATRSRTAVVVDEGLTGSIFKLWVKALQARVDFNIRIFNTLPEAEEWLTTAGEKVA